MNRFLQVTDQDADNQPVPLVEVSTEKNISEEEKIIQQKEKTLKIENGETIEKSYRKISRDISIQAEPLNNDKSRNYKLEDNSKLVSQSRKSSDCINQEEKTKDSLIPGLTLGKFKSLQNMNATNSIITLEKRPTEDTKTDTLQDKSEITQDQQQQLNISE